MAGLSVALQMSPAGTLLDFPFNEGPGSVVTSSTANGLVGSLGYAQKPENEVAVSPESPSLVNGDKSVLMNGVGFLVVNDTNAVFDLRTNAFTVEAWVKPDLADLRTLEGILGYGNNYKLGIMGGELVFTWFGVVDIRSGQYVGYGDWHHVAAVWEPGIGASFYVDGVYTFVADTSTPVVPTTRMLGIGAERLDNSFMGGIDRVRIHQAALTSEQLDSVAATPKAPLPSTLAAYSFSESAPPFQNAVTPSLPATSSEVYRGERSRPVFSNDTPSGKASEFSLNFATGTYVLVPDLENKIALDPVNPHFTAEAWVKFGALPQARSVLFGYNGPGAAFSISVTSDRGLFVTTYGFADTASAARIPDDGVWHHVAVVHEDGKELRFYVDGILSDTVPYAAGVLVGVRTDTTMTIGLEPGFYNQYVGLMDRVRVSNEALRADQLDYLAIPGVNPDAPTIKAANVMEISWPTVPAGYKLQSTTNLNDSASWTYVTNTPYTANGNYLFYAPTTGAKTFYRLLKP